jgi:uncharacterized coiled-coil DUF342 family protein
MTRKQNTKGEFSMDPERKEELVKVLKDLRSVIDRLTDIAEGEAAYAYRVRRNRPNIRPLERRIETLRYARQTAVDVLWKIEEVVDNDDR